jgi:hypothetical protein
MTGDVRAVVNDLLATPKSLTGIGNWAPASREGDRRLSRPLMISGEISDATLTVIAYPRSPDLKFRIVLTYTRAIWRLDYSFDERHVNPRNGHQHLPKTPINQPHYHSWQDNRIFATANSLPARLRNANVLPENIRSFQNAFRWFCGETNIILGTGDVPELPRSDRLL